MGIYQLSCKRVIPTGESVWVASQSHKDKKEKKNWIAHIKVRRDREMIWKYGWGTSLDIQNVWEQVTDYL